MVRALSSTSFKTEAMSQDLENISKSSEHKRRRKTYVVVVLISNLGQAVLVHDGLEHAKRANQVLLLAKVIGCSVGAINASTAM